MKSVEQILAERPDDPRTFLINTILGDRKENSRKCEITGLDANIKCKIKGADDSTCRYFVTDIFEALRRKGKLRNYIFVPVENEFSSDQEEVKQFESVNVIKKYNQSNDDRPATPPYKGFQMTMPGQNYHENTLKLNINKTKNLKFKPKTLSNGENVPLSKVDVRNMRIHVLRSKVSHSLGCDRLLGAQKLLELEEKRIKDELLGRIEELYILKGEIAPIGLRASNFKVLQNLLAHLLKKS